MRRISVIIPTYNGAKKIPALLDALAKQSISDFEVVVVIDGSTDATLNILHAYKDKFSFLKICKQPNSGRAKAKNQGVIYATGEILIFYDDDMEPNPLSVEKHASFHSSHTGLLSGNPIELVTELKTDIQNYKAFLTQEWTRKYHHDLEQLIAENLFFASANCSMPRIVFETMNGFDERLTDAEDYDFAYRSIKGGISVFLDQTNHAIHNDPITCVSYIRRLRQYNEAQRKLATFHHERQQAERTHGLKHIIYRLFAFSFIPKMIDQAHLIKVIPKRIRYTFYSIVIQALSVEYPKVRL